MERYCTMCGARLKEDAIYCEKCGTKSVIPPNNTQENMDQNNIFQDSIPQENINQEVNNNTNRVIVNPERKSRTTAGILGILLGPLGIHNFYLGKAARGIAQLFVTLLTCSIGGLWGITEGVMILAGYINEDGDGNPLE